MQENKSSCFVSEHSVYRPIFYDRFYLISLCLEIRLMKCYVLVMCYVHACVCVCVYLFFNF